MIFRWNGTQQELIDYLLDEIGTPDLARTTRAVVTEVVRLLPYQDLTPRREVDDGVLHAVEVHPGSGRPVRTVQPVDGLL